ncbi:FecCD family ABC transporter permease [Amycolatopsis sp. A1MSW2902]|uniref:FecCD family ABC transporter permease n=1 Tax=Amycolatopsis sp. A1MSW2902 TaxID=687413 RepID=UPI00307F228E
MTSPPRVNRGAVLALLALVLIACVVVSMAVGSRPLSLAEVWNAVTAPGARSDASSIVLPLRLPRTLLGLLVGAAGGAAGALSQGFTRNPLADPGILGVTGGAACAVVSGVYLLGADSQLQHVLFGLLGAAVATGIVLGISALTGTSPVGLVLLGTGLSAALLAVTSAIVLSDETSLDAWRFWNVGSLADRGLDVVATVTPFITVGLAMATACGVLLNALGLGSELSRSLGVRPGRARLLGIVTITILAGAATAASGPVAFLGLVAPHLARRIVGPDYRWIVPYSAVLGAVLLLACDIVGRVIGRPGELQTGIVLALVGAPFLMALVGRGRSTP